MVEALRNGHRTRHLSDGGMGGFQGRVQAPVIPGECGIYGTVRVEDSHALDYYKGVREGVPRNYARIAKPYGSRSIVAFVDGLKTWAKHEIQRANAKNVSEANSVAERLVELKVSSDKSKFWKEDKEKSGGDRPSRTDTRGQNSTKVGDDQNKVRACHICGATNHLKYNCPFRGKKVAAA